jgi:deazaflavin-dependent oxidoreductase (nitroreductase family)
VDMRSENQRVISEFRARQGSVGGAYTGMTMLLLHHVGVKTGMERVTPLTYWPVADKSMAVLASNFGSPKHPAWYHNLRAKPLTTVEVGGRVLRVRARVAGPRERQMLLRQIVAKTPSVAAAIANTAREIPIVLLAPSA